MRHLLPALVSSHVILTPRLCAQSETPFTTLNPGQTVRVRTGNVTSTCLESWRYDRLADAVAGGLDSDRSPYAAGQVFVTVGVASGF